MNTLPFPIEVGDKVHLNSKAPEWARDRVFTVDAIINRGYVQVWCPARAEDMAGWTEAEKAAANGLGLLAPFDWIDGPVKV
jgi:hypothetical protein